MAELQPTDEFLVNRSDTTYTQETETLMASLETTDYLLVNRSDSTYKITGQDFINSVIDPLEITVVIAPNPPLIRENAEAIPVVTGGKQPDGGYVFTYQWHYADDLLGTNKTDIPGQTLSTYDVPESDIAKFLGCTCTTTDALNTTASGTGYGGPVSAVEIAPIIDEVILTEVYDGENRYTDKEFPYTTVMGLDGTPDPTFALKAKLSGSTFNFGVESDTITKVEGAGTNVYTTDAIVSVDQTNITSSASGNTGGVDKWESTKAEAFDGNLDTAGRFDGSNNTTTQVTFNNLTSLVNPTLYLSGTTTYSVVTNLGTETITSTEERAEYGLNVGVTSITSISAEATPGTGWCKIHGITSGTNLIVNSTTLTFPTSNNFDKFEVGDVVQSAPGTNQSQEWSSTTTPSVGGYSGEIKTIFNGVTTADTTDGGIQNLPVNATLTTTEAFGNVTSVGYYSGGTSTITITVIGDTTETSSNITLTPSQSVLETFTTNVANVTSIVLTNTGGMGIGIYGVTVNGKLLVDASVSGAVSITAIDDTVPSITVDGGSWYGADGTGDAGDGRFEPSQQWSSQWNPVEEHGMGLAGVFNGDISNINEGRASSFSEWDIETPLTVNTEVYIYVGPGSFGGTVSVTAKGFADITKTKTMNSVADEFMTWSAAELGNTFKGLTLNGTPAVTNTAYLSYVKVDNKLLVNSSVPGGQGETDITKTAAYNTKLTVASDKDLGIITGDIYMTDGTVKQDGSGELEPASYTPQTNTIASVVEINANIDSGTVAVTPAPTGGYGTSSDPQVILNGILDTANSLDFAVDENPVFTITSISPAYSNKILYAYVGNQQATSFTVISVNGNPINLTTSKYKVEGSFAVFALEIPTTNVTELVFSFNSAPGRGVTFAGFGDVALPLLTFNSPNPDLQYFQPGGQIGTESGFKAVTYSGNSGSPQSITGVGFSPDLVWIKKRSGAGQHVLTDSVRGTDKQLFSGLANAEQTSTTAITSFDSDGFTLGTQISGTGDTNAAGSYVAWCFDAGDTTVTNNEGTIESQVRSNGNFSVVSYTGNGTQGASFGCGLSSAGLIIVKNLDNNNSSWPVYHSSLGNTQLIYLDLSAGKTTGNNWNNTTPSNVVSMGLNADTNENNSRMIAYCWAETPGVSSFGEYTGTGVAYDTPKFLVDCGFEPAFVMIKNISTGGTGWCMYDNKRLADNPGAERLNAESSAAAYSGTDDVWVEFASNGFKIGSNNTGINKSGDTYIYAAFAGSNASEVIDVDVVANTMTVDGGSFTAGDVIDNTTESAEGTIASVDGTEVDLSASTGRWIADNAAGIDFSFVPSIPVVDSRNEAYGKLQIINDKAQVTGIQANDPGFINVTAKDYSIQFPSVFATGNAPDIDLPFGTAISAIVKAENDAGTSVKESNVLLPLVPNPEGAAGAITASTSTELTVASPANLDGFVANDALVMVDETGAVASYTPESSDITGVTVRESELTDGTVTNTSSVTSLLGSWDNLFDPNYPDDNFAVTANGTDQYAESKYSFPAPITVEDITISAGSSISGGDFILYNGSTEVWKQSTGVTQATQYSQTWNGGTTVTGMAIKNDSSSARAELYTVEINGKPLKEEVNTTELTLNDTQDLNNFKSGDKVTAESATSTFGAETPAFTTTLYSGNGAARTITSGINNTDKSLVWVKSRTSYSSHYLWDTVNGANKYLSSDTSAAQGTGYQGLTSFTGNGFELGTGIGLNGSGEDYVAWNFRAAPGFMDIVTWDGNNDPDREIPHSLNAVPGVVIVKSTNSVYDWVVYHKELGISDNLYLNLNNGTENNDDHWRAAPTNTALNPTSSGFVNGNGESYVAYLFADTPGKIKCGYYDGGTSSEIPCGFKPGWVLIKDTTQTSSWVIIDTKRLEADSSSKELYADLDTGDSYGADLSLGATGFNVGGPWNKNSNKYIYIAIAEDVTAGQFGPTGELTADADPALPGMTLTNTTGDWTEAGLKVVGPEKSGVATFVSTNGTDTMTVSASNNQWVSNDNRLGEDFYIKKLFTALNANDPAHVAMQQAVTAAFAAFPQNVNARRTSIASSVYRLVAGETLTADEVEALTATVTTAVNAAEPFAYDGYYPLYYTANAANAASSIGDHHTHDIDGQTFYMPDGGTIYHGNYVVPEETSGY